jgi:hypothetical protein
MGTRTLQQGTIDDFLQYHREDCEAVLNHAIAANGGVEVFESLLEERFLQLVYAELFSSR